MSKSSARLCSISGIATLALLACAACGPADGSGEGAIASTEQELSGNALKLGYAGGHLDSLSNPMFDELFTTGVAHARLCHTYTSWDVLTHPGNANVNGSANVGG